MALNSARLGFGPVAGYREYDFGLSCFYKNLKFLLLAGELSASQVRLPSLKFPFFMIHSIIIFLSKLVFLRWSFPYIFRVKYTPFFSDTVCMPGPSNHPIQI
jgi:hypothetical protein